MSTFYTTDPGVETTRGNTDYTVIHKFGRNDAVGTTFVPIAVGGIYRTPQVSGATKLRVKAGNTNDTAAGTGAQKVHIEGTDSTGAEALEELVTAGTSASAESTNTYLRIYRAWVSESGTYASATAGSHAASIVIENSGGGTDWLTIDATSGFPQGQSEVAAYTVPTGKIAVIRAIEIHTESTKAIDILFFTREGILDTSAPYQAMRARATFHGVAHDESQRPYAPIGPCPAGTDIGFMAKVASSTASVSVDFEIWLYDA